MILGIDYFCCVGAAKKQFDLRPFLPGYGCQSSRATNYRDYYAAHLSLLVGDPGTAW